MNEVPDLSLLKLENAKYYICTYNNFIHSDSYHTFIHTYILWGFICGYPYICVLLVAYFSVALKIRYVVSICIYIVGIIWMLHCIF